MQERDVLQLLLGRRDSYEISAVTPRSGRLYDVVIKGVAYLAVLLPRSFDYYERRYHLAEHLPTLVICLQHTTVLPLPVLDLHAGRWVDPYGLPHEIEDVERQRSGKLGSQALLGLYLSGTQQGQQIISALPESTRKRYIHRAKALGKRQRGKPVAQRSHA